MIVRKLTIAVTTALLVFTAGTVHAEDEAVAASYTGNAPYVSLGGVFAFENVSGSAQGNGNIGNSGGYDLRAGYNLFEMFAAEIQWQSLLNFDRSGFDPVTNSDLSSLEARMLSFNGRFSPLSGRVQPYGLMGLGWVNVRSDRQAVDVSQSAFGMRFALGVAAYLTERTGVALEAAYILPLTGTLGGGDSFDMIPLTASIFFRFK